ncbi:maleylpyruvate isomerase N-terminal domain-containing protein [Nocardioides sp. C4-1]|uniref:maleylpyruvate isomerase N-terminal domain-containing protein n=1 Tax=Nocardioides sp. C4-1 TaxID=3151851 RepID=UPI00326522D4
MGLTVVVDDARRACAESVEAFVHAASGLEEIELLDASRCRGWTRLDVVVHVVAGWHEMLGGLVSPVDAEPTVDAASYWTAFREQYGDEDPVAALMAQRRRAAAFARPSSAIAQLQDVARALLRGVEACRDEHLLWQGHVFAPGDFLAAWAVEHVVHQLDLLVDEAPPVGALALARATVEALAAGPLPAGWTDEVVVLAGAGRVPAPSGAGHGLPVLG